MENGVIYVTMTHQEICTVHSDMEINLLTMSRTQSSIKVSCDSPPFFGGVNLQMCSLNTRLV